MSDYTVRFWRDNKGSRGVSIYHVEPVGWQNVDAELMLIGREAVDAFIERVVAARDSAFELPEVVGQFIEEQVG